MSPSCAPPCPSVEPTLPDDCARTWKSARDEIDHAVRNPHVSTGIVFERSGVDERAMLWPAAALAVLILGFAIVYGSVVQSRVDANRDRKDSSQTR